MKIYKYIKGNVTHILLYKNINENIRFKIDLCSLKFLGLEDKNIPFEWYSSLDTSYKSILNFLDKQYIVIVKEQRKQLLEDIQFVYDYILSVF